MLDPFTPWQEDPDQLEARTVGRSEPAAWLTAACDAYLDGGSPSWCLVTGARGAGKSHLLQLVRHRITDPAAVTWIGEDTPVEPDAARLWQRLQGAPSRWGWRPEPESTRTRRLLFVEGFDRLLAALKPIERWSLRHELAESGYFLVASAVSPSIATGQDDAFFGQFDTWSIGGLDLEQAEALFIAVSAEDVQAEPGVLKRRKALVHLAGGSPRAIVTLGNAVRNCRPDEVGTAEGLLQAIQTLVTHYQQRFHDLPALGQQILVALAEAPRQLTATEVKDITGSTSAHVSAIARVLEAAGTLVRTPDVRDKRVAHYALAEPMFRYWLEYRTTPSWEQTRVSWFARLLAEVLSPEQVLNVWWSSPPGVAREAVESTHHPVQLFLRAMAGLREDPSNASAIVDRVLELKGHDAWMVTLLAARLVDMGLDASVDDLCKRVPASPILSACVDFLNSLQTGDSRSVFVRLLREHGHHHSSSALGWALLRRVPREQQTWERFTPDEASDVIPIPFLRIGLLEAPWPGKPPLLQWEAIAEFDLEGAPDVQALVALATRHGDAAIFRRGCDELQRRLDDPKYSAGTQGFFLECPDPACPAPDSDSLAGLLWARESNACEGHMSWLASCASMTEKNFGSLLQRFQRREFLYDFPMFREANVTALLALALRDRERFQTLASCQPESPSIRQAIHTLEQLDERANGPLQPELELVWQAVAPPERR